ncbi:MAG: HdeA/HdeB family chaperone [Amaricoccus sp.]
MKRILAAAALAGLMAAPAFAQAEKVTCGDYSAMDNTAQMQTIADIESLTSEMAHEQALTADAIHDKLSADCKDKVDVLVIDVVKGYMN